MANINIDDYIKEMDLSPELEEKARQCNTASELMQLAAENDVELPMDALAGVAGGCGGSSECPKGGSHDWEYGNGYKKCKKCGEKKNQPVDH